MTFEKFKNYMLDIMDLLVQNNIVEQKSPTGYKLNDDVIMDTITWICKNNNIHEADTVKISYDELNQACLYSLKKNLFAHMGYNFQNISEHEMNIAHFWVFEITTKNIIRNNAKHGDFIILHEKGKTYDDIMLFQSLF